MAEKTEPTGQDLMRWIGKVWREHQNAQGETNLSLRVHISPDFAVEMAIRKYDLTERRSWPNISNFVLGTETVYDPGLEADEFLVLTYLESNERMLHQRRT